MSLKNWIKTHKLGTAIIVVSIIAVITVPTVLYHFVVNGYLRNKTAVTIFSEAFVSKWRNFSRNNTFKLTLQTSNKDANGKYQIKQGTAWSWYYQPTADNQFYDWYLLTNLHVVSDTLEYAKTQIELNPSIETVGTFSDQNKNIFTIGPELYIDLQYCDEIDSSNNQYVSLLNEPISNPNSSQIWTQRIFSKAQIITDNQVIGFDLFSANENTNNNYNLDMAFIKIQFENPLINKKATSDNQQPQKWTFQSKNIEKPYENYINTKPKSNSRGGIPITTVGPYDVFYFAANDHRQQKLQYLELEAEDFRQKYQNYQIKALNQQPVADISQSLYVFNQDNPIANWNLTSPIASGGAVYNLPSHDVNLEGLYPFGIYWGGFGDENSFSPAIIPLVGNFTKPDTTSDIVNHIQYNVQYNVYDNFTNCLSKLSTL